MRLTESERAENREALAAMSLPQKLDYIFEYYKFPLVLILIAVVALGSMLYYRLTNRNALLYVAYTNISVGDTLDRALSEGFTKAIGADPRSNEVKLYRNLYLSQDPSAQNHEFAYASRLKVMASVTNGQLDVLLMNRDAFNILSASGYLMPLETLLAQEPDLAARVAGRLVRNSVILEDNDIEHTLDESVPYQAITEEVANGLLVSAFPLFERAEFSGDVYLGVIGNSARLDAVLQYIDYLTRVSPAG